jgi:hypothetical protein
LLDITLLHQLAQADALLAMNTIRFVSPCSVVCQ